MGDVKLTHLQERRLRQLDAIHHGNWRPGGAWLTSHWSASRAANQSLVDMGLAERFGQTFHQPSGKPAYVGDVRITPAGLKWITAKDFKP